MFDALLNGRIDPRGMEFDVRFADIEELNRAVIGNSPAIGKISYAVLPEIYDRYTLLDSGSVLGHGNGPLLVARRGFCRERDFITAAGLKVAVPGLHTTANLLLQKLFPQLTDRTPILFSEIALAVARGEFDAGVLIHEGRFTYREHGLELVADLGAEWDRATAGLPLPLGAIVASRTLPPEVVKTFEELLRESIEYAFANPAASREFVKSHAREMAAAVIDSHIGLFVNEYSLSLGSVGRRAVRELTGIQCCHCHYQSAVSANFPPRDGR
jgi:1,4-dihydroxy-6-naphthoate synthase